MNNLNLSNREQIENIKNEIFKYFFFMNFYESLKNKG